MTENFTKRCQDCDHVYERMGTPVAHPLACPCACHKVARERAERYTRFRDDIYHMQRKLEQRDLIANSRTILRALRDHHYARREARMWGATFLAVGLTVGVLAGWALYALVHA